MFTGMGAAETYGSTRTTSFSEDLRRSQSAAEQFDLAQIFAETIPCFSGFDFASEEDDRQGTDVWVRRQGLPSLSVDLKIRSIDPITAYHSDDLVVEMFSVVEWGRPGWSVDEAKATDLVYWLFPEGRYVMAPFAELSTACRRNRASWLMRYRAVETVTKHMGWYRSQSLIVPTAIVMQAIVEVTQGVEPQPIVLH